MAPRVPDSSSGRPKYTQRLSTYSRAFTLSSAFTTTSRPPQNASSNTVCAARALSRRCAVAAFDSAVGGGTYASCFRQKRDSMRGALVPVIRARDSLEDRRARAAKETRGAASPQRRSAAADAGGRCNSEPRQTAAQAATDAVAAVGASREGSQWSSCMHFGPTQISQLLCVTSHEHQLCFATKK